MDDADRRWAEAEATLRGETDPELDDALRRRHQRLMLTVVIVVGGVFLAQSAFIAVVVLHHHGGHHVHHHQQTAARETARFVGLGLDVVALLLIVSTALMVRRAVGPQWNSPLTRLTRAQRQHLTRQITKGATVDPAHLALTQHLAERMIATRWLLLHSLALMLIVVALVLFFPMAPAFAYLALMTVLLAWGTIQVVTNVRRAQRFLARHPIPGRPA